MSVMPELVKDSKVYAYLEHATRLELDRTVEAEIIWEFIAIAKNPHGDEKFAEAIVD